MNKKFYPFYFDGAAVNPPPTPFNTTNSLKTGNISYYNLFAGNSNDLLNTNNGTNHNITFSSGAVFNGTTSYIDVKASKIDNGSTGTILIKATFSSFGTFNSMFAWGGGNANEPLLEFLITEDGGSYYPAVSYRDTNGNTRNFLRSTTAITTGVTYHFLLYSDANTYHIMQDNVDMTLTGARGESSTNRGHWLDTVDIPGGVTQLGTWNDNGSQTHFMDGTMFQFSYWNRVLVEYEQYNLYNYGTINIYPYVPLNILQTKKLLFQADDAHVRYECTKPVMRSDGKYLLCVLRYEDNGADAGKADVLFYTTTDFVTLTYLSTTPVPMGYFQTYPFTMGVKTNGNIFLICEDTLNASVHTRLRLIESTDDGLTWGNDVILRDNLLENLNSGFNALVLHAGRWSFAFEIVTSGSPGAGVYTGGTIYSDDDWATFTVVTGQITANEGAPAQCQESCWFVNSAGTLVRTFRTRTGPYQSVNTTDGGATYGSVYDMGILYNPAQANNISIIARPGGGYMCTMNVVDRRHMYIAYSPTGLTGTWTYYNLEVDAGGFEQVVGRLFPIGSNVYDLYTYSEGSVTYLSLAIIKIDLTTYP